MVGDSEGGEGEMKKYRIRFKMQPTSRKSIQYFQEALNVKHAIDLWRGKNWGTEIILSIKLCQD